MSKKWIGAEGGSQRIGNSRVMTRNSNSNTAQNPRKNPEGPDGSAPKVGSLVRHPLHLLRYDSYE